MPASAQQNGGCTHRDNVHCPLHPAPSHRGTLYFTRLEDKLLRHVYFSFHPRSRGSFSQGPNSRLCRCKNRNCQDSSTPRLQNVEKPQSRKCRAKAWVPCRRQCCGRRHADANSRHRAPRQQRWRDALLERGSSQYFQTSHLKILQLVVGRGGSRL